MHNNKRHCSRLGIKSLALSLLLLLSQPLSADEAAVSQVLDHLHQYASLADHQRYFALYHHDAVFLGTDRDEYWTLEEFKAYSQKRFATGTGWTYTPLDRVVRIFGNTAAFEEQLLHAEYGQLRGTGVLVEEGGQWRVAQYHLTLPIPNDMFTGIAKQIGAFYQEDKPRHDDQR